MNRERWAAIEGAFAKALELSADEQAKYLAALAQSDAALAHEVGALLEADARPHTMLGDAAIPAVAVNAVFDGDDEGQDPDDRAEGRQFGSWTTVRHLGTGGMGAVYLATRREGDFALRAALKLVKRGMDSAEITRRFQAERRILARLEHPNVARMLDGGTTPDGRPWFCMEYVEGRPITEYCDAGRIGIEARLKLFSTICGAVHYAHRNLVVHRDLKPGNILVSADGTLKLLDFGIAKLLSDDPDSGATLTRTGVRPMTPRYASPEQVRGDPVTTASDVYSLGVVFYELLCGRLPHRDALSDSALEDEILSTVPPRPSVAAKHTSRPDAPRMEIARELDDICLMALRKEPERRYASAEALREDIERHLSGLPVLATRDTVVYRARKFVRRHKAGTMAATGLLAVAGTFSVLYVTQLNAQRIRAEEEATKAREVASFLRSLFAVSDPGQAQGKDVTARELLEQGAKRVETDLAGQPTVQAEMMHVIGDVYHALGDHDRAQGLLERALARRRELLGPRHVDVAQTLTALAQLLVTRGTPAKAEPLHREALAIQETALGTEHADVAETLLHLGYALNSAAQYDSAAATYRRVIDVRQRLFGGGSLPVAEANALLAHTFLFSSNYSEAEALFRSALAVFRDSLSELHPHVRDNTFYLGNVLMRLGSYVAAESIYRDILRLDTHVLGAEHHDVLTDMNSLAGLLDRLGKFAEADTLFRRTLELRRKVYGEENRFVGQTLGDYGISNLQSGDLVAAESLYRQGHEMTRRTLGDGHSNLEYTLRNLSGLAEVRGDYAAARGYVEDAIRRNLGRASAPNSWRASLETDLARVLAKLGEREEAERIFQRSLATVRELLPKGHPAAADPLIGYGEVLFSTDRAPAAEPLLREALDLLERRFPPEHFRIAEARIALAQCKARIGQRAEAERLALMGHRALAARFAPTTWRMVEANERMADVYEALGRASDAARYRAAAQSRR